VKGSYFEKRSILMVNLTALVVQLVKGGRLNMGKLGFSDRDKPS